ncbi:MAG: flagellar motor switch protein FliN [Candidatus Methylomirabilis oxygeniifera]|uniref:Putative Flagellar motor switch phosphatase fliY (CheY-P phosphatase fliY) (Flagellar motor switch protein fliY) n=1 Tax=Methylomirabilis oxygeniifera TaxID=671143 RepID=D5MGB8_METO1|nr:MAG: flagellar motor switch protein FliN [Candidatus Methylomirabilis oxyfera]CBE68799.1 putative Flagellar motor switch phosphatase fliY (CheY-P phosphatase fliY) (Flagellar motor switch protein fliY) [Candidatus Methylomirabilis oxyfera]
MAHATDRRNQSASLAEVETVSSALERHGQLVFEASSQVFSVLCGRPVRLRFDRIVPVSPSTLLALLPGPCVGMAMQASQGLVGAEHLVWRADDAIGLAQLILGEEPTPGSELSADYLDALSEAANQIGGSLGTALRAALGKPVTVEAGTVTALTEAGVCLAVFREEASTPLLCVASLTREGLASGEVALIVSPSLLPETDKAQPHNDTLVAKEDTVSATSASAQAPFVPLTGGERVGPNNGIDMLLDVNLQVSVELGRTRLQIRDILQLGPGSIVELDKQAGDAVDILVNDKPIAKGEVIIIDENFGVRLTSITSVADRIKNLR